MPESAKNHPSLAQFMLDKMGVDRSGLRPQEAHDLLFHIIDSAAAESQEGPAPQPAAQPAAPSTPPDLEIGRASCRERVYGLV